MKILIVSEYFPWSEKVEIKGGVEARAFYIAKELAKKHDVAVITSLEKGQKKESEFANIKVYRVGNAREYTQAGSLNDRISFVRSAIKKGAELGGFDVVDGYNFLSYFAAYSIAKRSSAKSVATYHDVWLREWVKNVGLASGVPGEITERYILSRNWSHFIAVSNFTKQKLVNAGISPKRISVVHNGVNINEIKKIKAKKYAKPTVVCVGRLVKYKKIDTLVRAIGIIRKSMPDVQCNIIGSGPESESLNAMVKELKLEKNVHLLGFVPEHRDVLAEIKKSNVFCLPSSVEGFGMTVVEALACSVPCVISDIAPLLEVTENGKGCMVFKVNDVIDLAGKLYLLLKDKKLCKKKAGELSYIKKYDWKNISSQVEDVYRKL
jgi:glycosyltransferase involved in cell wall biosynthesis